MPEASLAEVNVPAKAFYLISAVGICASSSEARRQIKGGAARLEGEKITDPNQEFTSAEELEGKVLQLGKKTFRRLVACAARSPPFGGSAEREPERWCVHPSEEQCQR